MKTVIRKLSLIVLTVVLLCGTALAADNTAPTLTANPKSGSVVEPLSVVTITISDASNIAEVNYYWQGSSKKTINPNDTSAKLNLKVGEVAGKYILHVEAIDEEGNSTQDRTFEYRVVAEKDSETEVVEDTKAPSISMNKKSGSTLAGGTEIVVDFADDSEIAEVNYYWEGNKEKTINPDTNEVRLRLNLGTQGGKYILHVEAIDSEGNSTGERKYEYYVEVEDNDAPTVSVNKKSGSTLPGGTEIVVKFTDASKVAKVNYYWEGNEEKTITPNTNEVTLRLKLGTLGGKYILHVEAVDSEGNSTNERTYEYRVEVEDEEAPTIELSEKNGSTLPGGTQITFTFEDVNKIEKVTYNWLGNTEKTITPNTNSVDLNLRLGTQGGMYILYVTVVDDQGNSTGKQRFTFYVDEVDVDAPVITVTPEDGSMLPALTKIVLNASDESKITTLKYQWVGSQAKTINPNKNDVTVNLLLGELPGKYILKVEAIDEDGNESNETFTFYVESNDNEKPTVSVTPANGSTVKPGDVITALPKDNEGLSEIEYYWDNNIPESEPISGTADSVKMPEVPEEEGPHTLYVKVTDEAGNTTGWKPFTFYVEAEKDDELPTITMNPKSGSTVPGGKIIKATLRDNVELKKVEYYWNGEDAETENLSGALKTLSLPAISKKPGTYYMYIKLTDTSDNTTGWQRHVYYVEDDDEGDGEDPEVFADPDGGDVEYGDRITVWAEDDDGIEYIEYYWDDEEDDTVTKYDDEFTVKVPSEEGKHNLFVRAMDEVGDMCGWEKFVYYIDENNYPGNPDIQGELNKKVKDLRVEIRNADDKIKFEPEEEILYYVDYYNGSSSKVTNAKLVVELPTYLKGLKASDDGKITSNKITWSLGTLQKGDYGRVSFKAEYTSDKYNEKIITVPAKIYAGSSLKDTSTVRNLIYCDDGTGTGSHNAYCIGYPDGSFRPNGNITRAELAQMVANMEGLRGTYRGQFTDVPKDHWAANAIQACVDNGYVLTIGFSSFAPEQPATRGELAYAIAAVLGVEDLEPIFVCSSDLDYSDFRCAMEQLLRLGIMDGYSDGTARPNASITRAEAVTFINNHLFRGELIVSNYGYGHTYNYETGYNYGGNGTVLSFTDLSTSHWAYGHIMEATNNHRYERILDGNEKML